MTRAQRTELKANWHWKERTTSTSILDDSDGGDWNACTQFPSEVHVELIRAGRIPDPYIGFNEHDVQCMYQRLPTSDEESS
jgi:beta-mannosidase